MPDQYEREEQYLEEQLESGAISQKEYDRERLELQRDYRAAAEEAAAEAYTQELERW